MAPLFVTLSDLQIVMFQERRDGVTESCLYVNHVSADSFRRYTIIAENALAIGRQQTVLTERTYFLTQYPETELLLRCQMTTINMDQQGLPI